MVSTPSRNMLKPSISFPHPQRHQRAYAEIPRIGKFLQEVYSGAAKILRPLTDALKLSPKVFTWTAEIDSAFPKALQGCTHLSANSHSSWSSSTYFSGTWCLKYPHRRCSPSVWTLVPRHPYHSSQQSSQQQCRYTAYLIMNRLYHQRFSPFPVFSREKNIQVVDICILLCIECLNHDLHEGAIILYYSRIHLWNITCF